MTMLLDLDGLSAEATEATIARLRRLKYPEPPAPVATGRPRLAMRWRRNWADGHFFCEWVLESDRA